MSIGSFRVLKKDGDYLVQRLSEHETVEKVISPYENWVTKYKTAVEHEAFEKCDVLFEEENEVVVYIREV